MAGPKQDQSAHHSDTNKEEATATASKVHEQTGFCSTSLQTMMDDSVSLDHSGAAAMVEEGESLNKEGVVGVDPKHKANADGEEKEEESETVTMSGLSGDAAAETQAAPTFSTTAQPSNFNDFVIVPDDGSACEGGQDPFDLVDEDTKPDANTMKDDENDTEEGQEGCGGDGTADTTIVTTNDTAAAANSITTDVAIKEDSVVDVDNTDSNDNNSVKQVTDIVEKEETTPSAWKATDDRQNEPRPVMDIAPIMFMFLPTDALHGIACFLTATEWARFGQTSRDSNRVCREVFRRIRMHGFRCATEVVAAWVSLMFAPILFGLLTPQGR